MAAPHQRFSDRGRALDSFRGFELKKTLSLRRYKGRRGRGSGLRRFAWTHMCSLGHSQHRLGTVRVALRGAEVHIGNWTWDSNQPTAKCQGTSCIAAPAL